MKDFVNSWKSSKSPKKQRKYRFNAPLHIKKKFIGSNLSKELRKKHDRRNITIRTGDKVKVLRGKFRKHVGKITRVDIKKMKVYVGGVEVNKKEGTKIFPPIDPSNVQILELDLEDKMRRKSLERKVKK